MAPRISVADMQDQRLTVLEEGHRELLPAVARLEVGLKTVSSVLEHIDGKLDAGAAALVSHKTDDEGTALRVHDLEQKQKGKDKFNKYVFWPALVIILSDLVLKFLEHAAKMG